MQARVLGYCGSFVRRRICIRPCQVESQVAKLFSKLVCLICVWFYYLFLYRDFSSDAKNNYKSIVQTHRIVETAELIH